MNIIAPIGEDTDNLLFFELKCHGNREEWEACLRQIDGLDDEVHTVTMSWRNAKIIARPSTVRAWIEGGLDL